MYRVFVRRALSGVLGIALAGASAVGLATTAGAAGGADWSGFYFGANAGGAWGSSDLETLVPCTTACPYFLPSNAALINANGHGSDQDSSFIGGGQIGYNVQSGNIVYGLEVDADWVRYRAEHSVHQVYSGATTGLDIVDKVRADYLVTVRPRLGYATGNALLYVTGGLAVTTLRQSYSATEFGYAGPAGTCYPTSNNWCSSPGSSSQTKAGWTIGGGAGWAIDTHWSLKAEYLYADFGNISATSNLDQAPCCNSQTFDHKADLSLHTVRVGINYKLP